MKCSRGLVAWQLSCIYYKRIRGGEISPGKWQGARARARVIPIVQFYANARASIHRTLFARPPLFSSSSTSVVMALRHTASLELYIPTHSIYGCAKIGPTDFPYILATLAFLYLRLQSLVRNLIFISPGFALFPEIILLFPGDYVSLSLFLGVFAAENYARRSNAQRSAADR